MQTVSAKLNIYFIHFTVAVARYARWTYPILENGKRRQLCLSVDDTRENMKHKLKDNAKIPKIIQKK